ncbi:hypothetical protein I4U23_008464 [Adineta vaga]|nr:hypothetical protein I4U23_008464 [Adineta vaga]
MSSESRPSIRGYFKSKIKQNLKTNVTSSIRERLISNDTYHHMRDKYHNYTDIAKNRTGFDKLMNKTKTLLPNVFSSKENETYPKGFYDSLFSPRTAEDVYFEVAVLCLWTIAILSILPTIITIFIRAKKKSSETMGVKMIFFHIFLCELLYLIYILLSMINVAQNFQLNSVICDFANYGMYITIPVMHFALLFLSLERMSKLCKTTITNLFTKAYVIQAILITIWLIFIAAITAILILKKKFSLKSITNKVGDIAPSIFNDLSKKLTTSPYRCSIDGRLSSVFKILFIILFTILIILILKSMVISVFYKFFTPTCCVNKRAKIKSTNHMTLLYVLFLLLNVFFSFPFYFVSIAHGIFTRFTTNKETFTMKVKICFLLRLSSIILQCFAFAIIESNSWFLIRRLLYRCTCKKFLVLSSDLGHIETPISPITKPNADTHIDETETGTDESESESESESEGLSVNEMEEDDNDEVFIKDSSSKLLKKKQSGKPTSVSIREVNSNVNDSPPTHKSRKSTNKNDVIANVLQKKDKKPDIIMENTTPEHRNTNGISNRKSTSNRISSSATNHATAKSRSDRSSTKHRSVQLASSSSSDTKLDNNNKTKNDIKPSTTTTTTRSSSNNRKRIPHVISNEHHSHHRTKHSHVSRPTHTRSKRHSTTTETRRKSPRNTDHHSIKPKKDRLQRIQDHSDEV